MVRCAPYSQWQDPAERHIQTIMNMARASLAHGGGQPWMWGWAVEHSVNAVNRLLSPAAKSVGGDAESDAGAVGAGMPIRQKSRLVLELMEPSITPEKQMRTLHGTRS